MDLKKLILDFINRKGEVKASEIIKITGYSRPYVNRSFQQLRDEGKIALIGKANKAHYVLASEERKVKKSIREIKFIESIEGLAEHDVLEKIKRETGIFIDVKDNVREDLEYAFSEMLNNAIEHSKSEKVYVFMKRSKTIIFFKVRDKGVGIFNNIMQKKDLDSELEAAQDLLKGKQTTAPETHSGEGIFFTSKIADELKITSSDKKLMFNNIINDVFIENVKQRRGTAVYFSLSLGSKRDLSDIFRSYTSDSYEFSKTIVDVKLYRIDTEYISRSQARRVLVGLDKFKQITLDFKNVKTVGQAFADEVFHVWKQAHLDIEIKAINGNENVDFMIKRALARNEAGFNE